MENQQSNQQRNQNQPPPPGPEAANLPFFIMLMHFGALRAVNSFSRKREWVIVSATLIGTVCLAQLAMPAGGNWQDNADGHNAGQSIFATVDPKLYLHYIRANTLGVGFSLILIGMMNVRVLTEQANFRTMPNGTLTLLQALFVIFSASVLAVLTTAIPIVIYIIAQDTLLLMKSLGEKNIRSNFKLLQYTILAGSAFVATQILFHMVCQRHVIEPEQLQAETQLAPTAEEAAGRTEAAELATGNGARGV